MKHEPTRLAVNSTGKEKRITHQQFEIAVRKARAFVNNYDKVRFKIVELALSVCDDSHGGRKGKTFSLTNFANAIELHPKTLMEWCRIKKLVIDKLPATFLKDKSKYGFEDLRLTLLAVGSDATKKEVINAWTNQLAQPLENRKFIKYGKNLNTLLYNAQRPLNLLNVDGELLKVMASKCTLIAKLFTAELAFRVKYKDSDRFGKNAKKIQKAIEIAADYTFQEGK